MKTDSMFNRKDAKRQMLHGYIDLVRREIKAVDAMKNAKLHSTPAELRELCDEWMEARRRILEHPLAHDEKRREPPIDDHPH